MIWTRSLVTLVLVASVSRFGQSRALPTIARSCKGDICDNGGLDDSSLVGLPTDPVLPRFAETQNHDFDSFSTRQLLPRHEIRAAPLKPPVEPEPVAPGKPKPDSPGINPSDPDSPSTDPADNPSAGLDPTKPDSPPSTPADNPDEGLDPTTPEPSADPTAPKPSDDPNPSPSAGPDPATSNPKPAPDNNEPPDAQPSTVTDATGCGLKRADRPCPGASDNIGDDVPGETPDTAATTRANRPLDDNVIEYDYLDEVQRERGTGLVNDKLENLRNRIKNPATAEDDPVRSDEINGKFLFDSKVGGSTNLEVDDVFGPVLDHKRFSSLFKNTGVTLTDSRGVREAMIAPGAKEYTLKWSWSGDQKVAFTDYSYKKFDITDMSPKAHYTELTMALFKERGVDPKNIEVIAQTRIINKSTEKTIESIFESFNKKREDDVLVLSRSDTDPAKVEAIDAYFRTANGKGTVNLLAFHAKDWGFRQPQTLILQRTGLSSASTNSLVVLG